MAENNFFARAVETTKEHLHILKNADLIKQKANVLAQKNEKAKQKNHINWYFSDEGRASFAAAKTLSQKTRYFFDFVMAITLKGHYSAFYSAFPTASEMEGYKKVSFAIALVMAKSIEMPSKPFGDYPEIIDVNSPLLKISTSDGSLAKDPQLLCAHILGALHKKRANKFLEPNAYRLLTYCKDGEELSDLYKLEREIIGICCPKNSPFFPYDNYKAI